MPTAANSTKIFIVVDDVFLSGICATKLDLEGFQVVTAHDGEEGIKMALKELPDLILLDVLMPKLDGFEALKRIKAEPTIKDIPVIMLTNLGQKEDIEKGIEERADGFGGKELPFFQGVPIKAMVIFSRQFSVLIGAKVPIVQALRTVGRQTEHKKLRKVVADLATEVENGTPLSASMANHPKVFTPFFINMIRSVETTGRLEEIMNYMADQMERDYDLMTKIKG